jgi:hypothetical protein
MKNFILFFGALLAISTSHAQIVKTKIIDGGGSGPYKAIAASEKTLPNYVVYRPHDLHVAADKLGKLPILVWANGACANSSIHHERMLNEIASHGYIVLAVGPLQMDEKERNYERSGDEAMLEPLRWIEMQANTAGNDYFSQVDLEKIAVGGQSCGGAQTFRIAGDPRIKTYLIFNSGMGELTMAGASATSLTSVHKPIIYILGGIEEVAFRNAEMDFERINHVPIVFANHLTAGHGGTFAEPSGGSYSQMALDWLSWHFRDQDQQKLFKDLNLSKYPGWTIKSKGF